MEKYWGLSNKGRARKGQGRKLGDDPCGNCKQYDHQKCRPHLYKHAICTCSCAAATRIRNLLAGELKKASDAGQPEPTLPEALKDTDPDTLWQKEWKKIANNK
jgi:hypothetical protein